MKGISRTGVRDGRASSYLLQAELLLLAALLLPACAHMVNTLDPVERGMPRDEALQSVLGNPRPYFIGDGTTEYVLYRVSTNLIAMYGESPHDVLFVRLEDQRVVDKGVVGRAEERRIRAIHPGFDLRLWQAAGVLPDGQLPASE